jgi:hypothetical protein
VHDCTKGRQEVLNYDLLPLTSDASLIAGALTVSPNRQTPLPSRVHDGEDERARSRIVGVELQVCKVGAGVQQHHSRPI